MGRAFEYRKATKLKRWGHMAKTFTKLGKQIAIAVKAGGPEPENNPTLRAIIANCKRENMPKDNIARAIKNACGKDTSDYKEVTYEGYGPHGVAVFVDTLTDNTTRTVADVRSIFNTRRKAMSNKKLYWWKSIVSMGVILGSMPTIAGLVFFDKKKNEQWLKAYLFLLSCAPPSPYQYLWCRDAYPP